MKSLVRLGITLGLVSSTLLTAVSAGISPALALPEEEIVKALDTVPVFLITNGQGLPLSRPLNNGQNGQNAQGAGSVAGVYMSRQEAQAFINELRNAKGKDQKMEQLVNSLQVTAVPLGKIYDQLRRTVNEKNRLVFAFKPLESEVKGALELLRKTDPKISQFPGVPIFIVRFGPKKNYVPIKLPSANSEIIPLFFSKEDALGLLKQVKPKYPEADVQVVDVDGIIQTLKQNNDPWLNQVVLVPSKEAREYIRALPVNSANPGKPPTNQPPKKR